jgi:hypothetical protein
MNYTIILLAVVVVILIYILRSKVFKSSSSLNDRIALTSASSTPAKDIDNPTSYRYAYGMWIYMNSWSKNVAFASGTTFPKNNNIFNRSDEIQLYLDETKPTLYFYVKTKGTPDNLPIVVTENFPIQKWVYFVANVDGQYIDLYLNGKLVKSIKIPQSSMMSQPTATSNIITGGALDGFAAKFKRWSHTLTPKDVWSNYMNGSGGNSLSKMFSSYGVDVALVKDNVEQKSIRLF